MSNKLSIITINYNNLDGLKRTVESVLHQTFIDYEYIIIDGGSTDGSTEYIEENADGLTYWVSENDEGIYHAMNKGWSKASGDYCLFLNSGDYLFEKDVLFKVTNYIQNLKADVYYGDLIMKKSSGNLYREVYPDNMSLYHFIHSSIPHPASFISLNMLKTSGGFDEGYKIISDWFFFLKVWLGGAKLSHMAFPVSVFSLDGISSVSTLKEIERKMVIENELSLFKHDFERLNEYRYFKLSRIHQFLKKLMK